MSIVLLIIGLILFIGLVVIHEFGHFLAARRNGVEVEEFGIGFPPRAWAKKTKDGFDFSINWLPIGGFVKLKGESDAAKEKGSLGAATTWSKTKIMLAGVGMNLLIAFILLTALAWLGLPKLIDNQFTVKSDTTVLKNDVLAGYVEPKSPAAKAGIEPRDQLLTIVSGDEKKTIKSADDLPGITERFAGKEVTITYKHEGKTRSKQTTLLSIKEVEASRRTDTPKGYLGISPTELTMTRSTWSAPIVGAGLIGQFTAATFQGLGTTVAALFQGDGQKAAEQVSGPVGIVVLLKDGSLLGYQFMLMIIAIISLTLAIMNVLPIPALDGGRLFMVLLSRLFGKQISQEMEERIVGASFLLLMFLIVLITIVDVKRFF
ncbi:MAG TPA: M50 family metallopeptidase [Candidatus Saccharimonadales bacterium]|nr:M50 family metallopeptidase [Candidatus Saccharimonadales bacterium]